MVCSPVSSTINGYQQITVGEKALQCVLGWEDFSPATQILAEGLCFRTVTLIPKQ